MLSSLSEVKENVNITNDFTKEDKSSATNSILKPSQKENVSLVQWFTPKKPPKVTFKNTPLCYRPACYKAELLQSKPDTWEEIRNLDEVENWTERTQVVTKEDHQIHLEAAKGFLEDIINTLPCIKSPEIQTRKVEGKESPNNIGKVVAQETNSVVERVPNKTMDDGFDFEGVGPLDPAIASLNSLLKAGEDEERAFSPIGSERTSPDCDTMVTSEDIEKLLAKHDMPDDGIIPPLELSHGSRIDAMMDSKFSIQSLEEMTAKLDQLKLMSPKLGKGINQIGDEEESLPVKRRGTKTPPGKEAKESKERQEEKENIPESDDFSLPVKKREPKTAPKISVELNDDNKFKKPMPPKPWKTKNRKVPKQDDQPVVMFPDSGIKVFNGNGMGKLTSKTDESTHTAPQLHPFENDLKHCVSMQEDITNISVRNSQGSEEQPPLEEKSSLEVNGNEKEKRQYNPFQDDLPATEEDFKLPENEDFKSSGEAFSLELDYLEKFGNTGNLDGLSALARQSLYVKFDPLVKGSPDKDLRQLKEDALNSKQKAPANLDDLLLMSTPPNLRAKQPRLAAIKETQGKDTTNLSGVDKLLTFSPLAQASSEESAKKQVREETKSTAQTKQSQSDDPSLVEPLLYSKSDIAVAVNKEREALLKQTHEESAIRDMEIQEIQSKLQSEIEGNAKLRRENDELRTVMNEYERTMAEMIETSEKNKNMNDESKNEIVKERDQLQADLNSVEAAFSDLHGRYEKLKGVLENYKKNEEILKKATIDYQEKLRKSGEKYQMLKKHAEEKIETANIEINRVRRSNDSEMAVMRAALKKEQNKCASLEQAIQQKINENKELTAICDELIQRASGAK